MEQRSGFHLTKNGRDENTATPIQPTGREAGLMVVRSQGVWTSPTRRVHVYRMLMGSLESGCPTHARWDYACCADTWRSGTAGELYCHTSHTPVGYHGRLPVPPRLCITSVWRLNLLLLLRGMGPTRRTVTALATIPLNTVGHKVPLYRGCWRTIILASWANFFKPGHTFSPTLA